MVKLFFKGRKHVLRYLRGTIEYGLWYRQIEGVKLQGFTNADWARSPSNRKSTSGGMLEILRGEGSESVFIINYNF